MGSRKLQAHQKALPTTLFFYANGEVVSARIGELWRPTLEKLFR